MAKTDPTSIRFDEGKLNFVKTEENLPTRQKVVDFLLEKYWWEKKVGNPPTFERQIIPHENRNLPQPEVPKITQFEAYKNEILAAKNPSEIARIVSLMEKDEDIFTVDKVRLKQFGIQRSKEIDF